MTHRTDGLTPPNVTARGPLTEQQYEVLRALANGESTAQTAARLALSLSTIRSHRQRLYRRLGVHSAAHAVGTAFRIGLLGAEEVEAS